jgi:UDP-N-acetylmuramate dehydrogenase
MISIDDIKNFFRGSIALHEPLSSYTSFRIGGPADYYLEPADKEDVVNLINYMRRQNYPFIILGRGSNLLVSDEGVRCAVVNFEHGLNSVRYENEMVVVEAGVTMARFVDFCIQRGLKGVEMLAGIPGTLGGAVIMNAGAYGGEISDHLVDVEVLRGEKVITVSKADSGFVYRRSGFQNDIVLSARFALPSGKKEEIALVKKELLLKRNQSQPLNFPNSGSMFKNPPGTHAAKLIEQVGLKGTQSGQAMISDKHANFIVNLGGATANDVLELISRARKTVFEKLGINLELEVKLIGFSESMYKEAHS